MKTPLRSLVAAFIGCAFTATSLVAGGTAPAQATGAEVSDGSCADITVLGLAGSSQVEPGISDSPGQFTPNDPFGHINTVSIDSLVGQLTDGTTVKRVSVPYVKGVERIDDQDGGVSSAGAYRSAMGAGVDLLEKQADEILSECTTTRLVFIGSFQGAQVVHEAVTSLPQSIMDKTAAVWLISDPIGRSDARFQYRYAGDDTTPRSGAGQFLWSEIDATIPRPEFLKFAPEAEVKFDSDLDEKLISVCLDYDHNCVVGPPTDYTAPPSSFYPKTMVSAPAAWVAKAINASLSKPSECADVTFFAARGSGEPTAGPNSGYPAQNKNVYMEGFGTTLATMAYAIQSNFAAEDKRTFDYVSVDYDAVSVEKAMVPNSPYPASVLSGIRPEAGPKQFRDVIAECPYTQIVMLGYSQGGHVIHEILMTLEESERKHIKSVVLIADAIRNPLDKTSLTFMGANLRFEHKDSAIYNGMGAMRAVAFADLACLGSASIADVTNPNEFFNVVITHTIHPLCLALPNEVRFSDVVSVEDFPSDLDGKILNVCNLSDIVCDAEISNDSDMGVIEQLLYKKETADYSHGELYKLSNFYEFPSNWAYKNLIGID